MGKYYFHKSAAGVGFWNDAANLTIPDGAKPITAQQYKKFSAVPPTGTTLDADADGMPVFVPMAMTEPPADVVPQQVTRAQGKAALIQAGLWGAVEVYVEGIADPTEKAIAQVALNDTTHWHRTSPFLKAAAQSLGLTDAQLDDLFIQASSIEL